MKRVFSLFIVLFIFVPAVSSSESICPPQGDGGDPILNRLKNRTGEPSSFEEMDVNQFMRELPYLFTPLFRDDFSKDQKQFIEKKEKHGISLVGYIFAARLSLPDSTNCHSKIRREIHIYMVEHQPQSDQELESINNETVVVEITPAGQDLHLNWKLQVFGQLAKRAAKIRVSGWPLYDSLDKNVVGKTRGTIWEIDPVTKMEVWKDERWSEF
jgi:hypothetical protein